MSGALEYRRDFDRRIEEIARRGLVDATAPVEVRTIQNDGTGPATAECRVHDGESLIAKLFRDDTGERSFEILSRLWTDGFGESSAYQVPHALGYDPQRRLLVMTKVAGDCLDDLLDGDPDAALAGTRRAARWLARLHDSPARLGAPDTPWYRFVKMADRISKAAAAHPDRLRWLTGFVVRVGELQDRQREVALVQGHGQFRPIHVFLADGVCSVIDLDRSRPADPARDVAEFVHRLRSTLFRKQAVDRADPLATAFIDEYESSRPGATSNLPFYLGFHVLVSLCRHVKQLSPDDPEWDRKVEHYTSEFEMAVAGRFGRGAER